MFVSDLSNNSKILDFLSILYDFKYVYLKSSPKEIKLQKIHTLDKYLFNNFWYDLMLAGLENLWKKELKIKIGKN